MKNYGFIGLGQMGSPMAANLVKANLNLYVFDKAGTAERAPQNSIHCNSVNEIASNAEVIFLSLPDAKTSMKVASELAIQKKLKTKIVIDLSTIGPVAAQTSKKILLGAGIEYIDSPVSGGAIGAQNASITIMWAGSKSQFEAQKSILSTFSKNQFHIGSEPGQGQAVKILNNYLSGTAMIATSEAIIYGLSQGVDMKTMLEVINVSTGQNTASRDKFPDRILTRSYDAGFKTELLAKDLRLFVQNAKKAGTPTTIGDEISKLWDECYTAMPESDITRMYDFIRHNTKKSNTLP